MKQFAWDIYLLQIQDPNNCQTFYPKIQMYQHNFCLETNDVHDDLSFQSNQNFEINSNIPKDGQILNDLIFVMLLQCTITAPICFVNARTVHTKQPRKQSIYFFTNTVR